MDSINYQLDIETSVIVDAVRDRWKIFQRDDLIDLSSRFTQLLIKKNIDSHVYDRNTNPKDFDKYLKEIIPDELKRTRSQSESPIPGHFYTRKRDVITVFPYEVPIRLYFGEPDFNVFFAFKLATIEFENINSFLDHQLAVSFNQDKRKFKNYLRFILSDQKSIFNGRLVALTDFVEQFFEEVRDNVFDSATSTQVLGKRFLSEPKNDGQLEKIFFSSAIPHFRDCEQQLLERKFLNANYQWQKTGEECATFIVVLFEKNYLKKPVRKNQQNIRFSKSFKPFFEHRYQFRFAKQLQPKYRSSSRIEVFKQSFGFIEQL